MPERSKLERALAAALDERGPDGQPRFSREEVRDVVGLLLLAQRPATLPPEALQLLGELSLAAGAPQAGPGQLQRKLDAYFAKHPPRAELLARLRDALKP